MLEPGALLAGAAWADSVGCLEALLAAQEAAGEGDEEPEERDQEEEGGGAVGGVRSCSAGEEKKLLSAALVDACRNGAARAAAWLLERGAASPAAAAGACEQGHPEILEALLLRRGADADSAAAMISFRDSDGHSALDAAARGVWQCRSADRLRRCLGCATLLLDHGGPGAAAGPEPAPDEERNRWPGAWQWGTPLHSVCEKWGYLPADEEAEWGAGSAAGSSCEAVDSLVLSLLAAGADPNGRPVAVAADGPPPLAAAARCARPGAARALCALGADAAARFRLGNCLSPYRPEFTALHEVATIQPPQWVGGAVAPHALACVDELIERGADPLAPDSSGRTPLAAGLDCRRGAEDGTEDARWREERAPALALILARWPPGAPLPLPSGGGGEEPPKGYKGVSELLPAALEHAIRRAEVLRAARDDAAGQAALADAFLGRVTEACGGAVAPCHAPFARCRFVEGGGLLRAHARLREVHRFPAERVALCKAALLVAMQADVAAAQRCVAMLLESEEEEGAGKKKRLYAAVRAVGRWGEIRAAARRAERALLEAEGALGAAVDEAEAAAERLRRAAAGAAAGD